MCSSKNIRALVVYKCTLLELREKQKNPIIMYSYSTSKHKSPNVHSDFECCFCVFYFLESLKPSIPPTYSLTSLSHVVDPGLC